MYRESTKSYAGQGTKNFRLRGLKFFVSFIGFLYGVVWQLSNQQIYFSVNGPFVPSWLGLICLCTRILHCQILFCSHYLKNFTAGRKKIVPGISLLLGKKLYPAPVWWGKKTVPGSSGTKIVADSDADCTRLWILLTTYPGCRVQIRYCVVLIQTRWVQRGHWPEKSITFSLISMIWRFL